MIWFTADFHLSHTNIIKFCNRPFRDVEEMNAVIQENLFKSINSGDILYYLGDLKFNLYRDIATNLFEKLKNIETHYITGNHDSAEVIKIAKIHCATVSPLKHIVIEGKSIILCHYAMRVWHKSHFNSWQLYGHSHGRLDPVGKQYDIGVDNNNFQPVSFELLKNIMKIKPDNFNYIPPESRRED